MVINDVYRLAPCADLLYACDPDWWEAYAEPHVWLVDGRWYPGATDFQGYRVTQNFEAAQKWGLYHVPTRFKDSANTILRGLSRDPCYLHPGSNSGFQALNLAVHLGAARILLMGFDMGYVNEKTHFFGNHPPGLQKQTPFDACTQAFESAVPDLAELGVEVFNLSMESHMECFPKRRLADVL